MLQGAREGPLENLGRKSLIVNADDFGLSAGVNRGIVRAREAGILTSASLMVRQAGAGEAADYGRRNPEFSIGLHVDLGEWVPQGDEWKALYEVVDMNDSAAVEREVRGQVAKFEKLIGQGPTHLDSHQHVHRSGAAHEVVVKIGRALGVPVRHFSSRIRYCGEFYGHGRGGETMAEWITPAALVRILEKLEPGVTELACHPGEDDGLESPYRLERRLEVAALCDPSVKQVIKDREIELVSFSKFPELPTPARGGTLRKLLGRFSLTGTAKDELS